MLLNDLKLKQINLFNYIMNFILFTMAIISIFIMIETIELEIIELLYFYGIASILLIIQLNFIKIQNFGPAYVVILYTIITHFGVPIAFLFSDNSVFINNFLSIRHLYIEHLPYVLSISYIGCYSFFMGTELIRIPKKFKEKILQKKNDLILKRNYIVFSVIICYIFALLLIILVFKNNLLQASYATVIEAFETPLIAYPQRLFWISIIPIVILGDHKTYKIVSIPIIIITILLLLTGNRNDILIPLTIGFALFCLKKNKVPKTPLILGFLILFVVNPAIAVARQDSGVSFNNFNWGFTDALKEMGAQINPFTQTLNLHKKGLPFFLGKTIFLPTIAILNLNIFYTTEQFLESIYSTPVLLSYQNHFGQGYSMLAEFWLNFGFLGVVIVMLIYGMLSKYIENLNLSKLQYIFYGQFSLLMMYWVRNDLQFNVILLIFSVLLFVLSKIFRVVK